MNLPQKWARMALQERQAAIAPVLEFELPAHNTAKAPGPRRWVFALSEHAIRRCEDRQIQSSDLFAAVWLGGALKVREPDLLADDDYRVSYLYNDVVVISKPPITREEGKLAALKFAHRFLPEDHHLNDAHRTNWCVDGHFFLHAIITAYRRGSK